MSELIDNKVHRIRTLKHIIKHLHTGGAPGEVRTQMHELVRQTDHSEILAMEQELMAEGMPVEEVISMCDMHSQVTRDVLVSIKTKPSVAPGHPVDTFKRENEALLKAVEAIQTTCAEVQSGADSSEILFRLKSSLNELMDIDKHYQRKEHALFSCLERHGISGPSKVMWAKDDEVRSLLKKCEEVIKGCSDLGEIKTCVVPIAEHSAAAVAEMVYKEENILLPMSLEMLTEQEWAEIWAVSPRYGWCLVEPREGYAPPESVIKAAVELPQDGVIMMPTGNVSVEQLHAVLATLPLDLTFVDANDRVAFFTEGPDRIFARSKAIIGRKVQNCHPPRSVEIVDRILGDFRSGRQNVADSGSTFMASSFTSGISRFAIRTAITWAPSNSRRTSRHYAASKGNVVYSNTRTDVTAGTVLWQEFRCTRRILSVFAGVVTSIVLLIIWTAVTARCARSTLSKSSVQIGWTGGLP